MAAENCMSPVHMVLGLLCTVYLTTVHAVLLHDICLDASLQVSL